jgi:hypothetical protein
MAKRTNRVAWRLAMVLAVALVAGTGAILTHGISVGQYAVWFRPTGGWAVGRGPGISGHGLICQRYHLGLITLHTTIPDPIVATTGRGGWLRPQRHGEIKNE